LLYPDYYNTETQQHGWEKRFLAVTIYYKFILRKPPKRTGSFETIAPVSVKAFKFGLTQ